MSNYIFAMIFMILLTISAFSQIGNRTSTTKWESYSVKDKNVTVSLPKLPVLVRSNNYCNGEDTARYGAYSDNTAYVLSITSKVKVPEFCANKKEFDQQNFEDRLNSIRKEFTGVQEINTKKENLTVKKFVGKERVYWLFNDFENKRWFEIWVVGATETKPEVKNFFESFKIEKKPAGREIGEGSDRTLGDAGVSNSAIVNPTTNDISNLKNSSGKSGSSGIFLVIKPRPSYTEAARQNNIQGVVRLRVTFLASGGIGGVTPISALPDGLTEQAIAAARKIVFLPARREGVNYSVTKLIEYSFSTY